MTKEFAETKLQQLFDAYIAALKAKGASTTALTEVDPVLKDDLMKTEKGPMFQTTKDGYGAYLSLVGKDGLKAVIFWKHGGNPVGILTALFINMGISLP